MQISFWAFLSVSIITLPGASSKSSEDAAHSIIQGYSEDSSFDQFVAGPLDPSDIIAPLESPTDAVSDGDVIASVSPEGDGSEIFSSKPDAGFENKIFSPEGLIPAFETAFAPDKDAESARPPCTSPSKAACCVEDSMFTSCVWWDLDRIFCEDPNNYACCESIQDYIGSNCDHIGEEGKDWDWLEDILRTPIILGPPINPFEYLPPTPLIPERV